MGIDEFLSLLSDSICSSLRPSHWTAIDHVVAMEKVVAEGKVLNSKRIVLEFIDSIVRCSLAAGSDEGAIGSLFVY